MFGFVQPQNMAEGFAICKYAVMSYFCFSQLQGQCGFLKTWLIFFVIHYNVGARFNLFLKHCA